MSNWASRLYHTPVPRGVPPLTRLANSQAERFGIQTAPIEVTTTGPRWRRRDTVLKRGTYPSFAYKVHESARRMQQAKAFGSRLAILAHDRKDDGYRLAEAAGVPYPIIHARPAKIDDLDWAAMPDRIVVKPLRGAASRGVFLLERRGAHQWYDHLGGELLTEDEVVRRVGELVAANTIGRPMIVEELLAPHPDIAGEIVVPDDLKVFTFYDHPAVIMQRRCFGTHDMTKYRFRFWDGGWNDLGPVKYANRIDPQMPPPTLRDEVLDAASRIGRTMGAPFARIDVYETARGVVFGEITPHPGPLAGWREDLDRLLGYEWEIAETRLAADGRLVLEPRP
ncbi:MAG: ATP-grasp fold amidoligase family protein [Ilumatobacteraceae bacterium]